MASGDQKKSLTQPPGSLKEAVDWVLCISGYDDSRHYQKGKDTIKVLAMQLKSLLSTVRVENVNVNTLLQGDLLKQSSKNAPIASLAGGVKALIDKDNGMGNSYTYSCKVDDPSSNVDEKSAKMFLGMVPLLFFGLGFLFYMCRQNGGRWSGKKISNSPLKDFLEAVGFPIEQLSGGKPGYDAVSSGLAMLPEFRIYESTPKTFPEYLSEVEKHSKRNLNSNPNYAPLGALYLFTFKYLKTKNLITTSTTDDGIPLTENDITTLLKQLGEAVKNIDTGTLILLSSAYTNLADAIDTAMKAPDPSADSSVAGPVTGTLATAGLLGGGSAVYFNVGGAKTLVNGLLNFR
ncbi:variant erythrocyte surface antigen-1 family protein [Babesia caballi]|uniref:Variant erythrocyte surface antigen-1 family protein n=1 Tax=Babesia caballi TaxID=5871 RepID=A0AAV4LU16_BABCB|nr:variant erythrocyte surface antigen-1 family protein [Babesia caballi]